MKIKAQRIKDRDFGKGKTAALNGVGYTACPFEQRTKRRLAWLQGYGVGVSYMRLTEEQATTIYALLKAAV